MSNTIFFYYLSKKVTMSITAYHFKQLIILKYLENGYYVFQIGLKCCLNQVFIPWRLAMNLILLAK